MNIIQLTQGELEDNLPFSLNLVEKGHTLKVTTNKGIVCIISPVASVAPLPPDMFKLPVSLRPILTQAFSDVFQYQPKYDPRLTLLSNA